jgi:hypothetical protein
MISLEKMMWQHGIGWKTCSIVLNNNASTLFLHYFTMLKSIGYGLLNVLKGTIYLLDYLSNLSRCYINILKGHILSTLTKFTKLMNIKTKDWLHQNWLLLVGFTQEWPFSISCQFLKWNTLVDYKYWETYFLWYLEMLDPPMLSYFSN